MARTALADDDELTFHTRRRGNPLPWVLLVLSTLGFGGLALVSFREATAARRQLGREVDQRGEAQSSTRRTQEALLAERQAHSADLDKLKSAVEAAVASASAEKTKADAAVDDLTKSIQKGEGEIVQGKGKLTLNLVDKVLFPVGKAELSTQGEDVLKRVGATLNKYPDRQVWVIGHTDDLPIVKADFKSNWELSTARAVNVVHYLQDQAKVDPKRLAAAGFSSYRPASRTERAKNRRIELVLFPADVEVKP